MRYDFRTREPRACESTGSRCDIGLNTELGRQQYLDQHVVRRQAGAADAEGITVRRRLRDHVHAARLGHLMGKRREIDDQIKALRATVNPIDRQNLGGKFE